jgi:hypothetical protein
MARVKLPELRAKLAKVEAGHDWGLYASASVTLTRDELRVMSRGLGEIIRRRAAAKDPVEPRKSILDNKEHEEYKDPCPCD